MFVKKTEFDSYTGAVGKMGIVCFTEEAQNPNFLPLSEIKQLEPFLSDETIDKIIAMIFEVDPYEAYLALEIDFETNQYFVTKVLHDQSEPLCDVEQKVMALLKSTEYRAPWRTLTWFRSLTVCYPQFDDIQLLPMFKLNLETLTVLEPYIQELNEQLA